MESLKGTILFVAASTGAVLANVHLPKGELELKIYPKVSAAEFAAMREGALHLVTGDTALGAGLFGDSYFELSCRDVPTQLVDNSSSQLLIIGFADRTPETTCAQPLHSRWNNLFVQDE